MKIHKTVQSKASTGTASYSYVPNSNLLSQLSTDSGLLTTYSYEPKRDLRTQIRNEYNSNLISQYDYNYNELGSRTSVQNSGQAFSADEFNLYNYNDRNELTESARYIGADISDTTNPVEPEYRSYNYDPIGNRNDATEWDKAGAVQSNLTYTSNQLNQYELIINDIGQPADSLTYDTDGNLTSISDGTSTTQYIFNAENRLISVEPETPSDGDTKVEFVYDYMGRRVKKEVYIYQAGNWELDAEGLFIYDGWNLIEELVTRNSQLETRYFVWGLDLSQSLQGAGGIGGLITAIEGVDSYQYFYDGNGNVGQLINTADGSIVAHYEYDPYGNELKATGPEAQNNVYRFSTKYFDEEVNLYYYGYRYYSAELGRWLNRDPIGEMGGINVYRFNYNSPIDKFDYLGLLTKREKRRIELLLEVLALFDECKNNKSTRCLRNWDAGGELLLKKTFGRKWKKNISKLSRQLRKEMGPISEALSAYQETSDVLDNLGIDRGALKNYDLSKVDKALKNTVRTLDAIDIIANIKNPDYMTPAQTMELFSKTFSLGKSFAKVPLLGVYLDAYDMTIGKMSKMMRFIEDSQFENEAIKLIDCSCCCDYEDGLLFWYGTIGEVVRKLVGK